MSDPKKLIVVLGAHRSGTSLCAAAIESLGADTCLGEHYANEENSKGFFEHPDIVDFNDSLLAHLGGSWDNPLFDGSAAMSGAALDSWQQQATQLLQRLYGKTPVAVVKDPRMCQLLGFWTAAFDRAGYAESQVFYVHTLRDPVEVAISQRNRAAANPAFYELGRSLAEGGALWLSLTGQALASGGQANTHYLSYQLLMTEAQRILQELARFIGMEPEPARVQEFCQSFVDPSLYRSSADQAAREELAELFPQVLEFDSALQPLLENSDSQGALVAACLDVFNRPDTRETLAGVVSPGLSRLSEACRTDRLEVERSHEVADDLRRQAEELAENTERMRREHEGVVVPLRSELGSLQSGNQNLQQQLSEQAAELAKVTDENRVTVSNLMEKAGNLETDNLRLSGERDYLQEQREDLAEHIHQMEQSTSWKLTRPVRSLSHRLQAFRGWMARQWVQLRLKAILIYHRLSLRHAGLAWTIRRLLRPIFRMLNKVFSAGPKGLPRSDDSGLLTPMRYQQQEVSEEYQPLVSVIVPNYNHAPYLELRLDSIFSQTYQNFEVILLDDASSDDSAAILREYQQRYPDKTTLLINEENSGGVFHQWDRGFGLAQGDIVWIAESDDWCTENFLETLVPYFENEAIQLAYARTVFMDGEGDRQIWSINEYLHDIDPQRWNNTIIETGPAIVRDAFAVKNIVPNVSSAIFRTPRTLEVLQDPEWRQMRTCGDWVLYLHLLRGGMLAYSPAACNYYRIHDSNTSVASYSQDQFYREHEIVAKTIQQYFSVPAQRFSTLRDNLEIHWREKRGEYSDEALERCYSLERIEQAAQERAPNLLMASYAFCSGGGETFPVGLANIMKKHGYNVTYLDCARETRLEGVRQKLRGDIPIVSDFTQLERIIADFEIDIVHSHHAWVDSTILDILPEDIDCKTVVTLHGMYETINEYDLRPILPRLVQRSACLIYVADKNLDAIRSHGLLEKAKVACIDNALENEAFEPVSRQSLGIAEDAFVLTLVSRAMVEKGWAEAVESVTAARNQSGVDIQLLLVGDGSEYDRLMQDALPEFVHLAGFQRNVRGYFAAADLGFLPSKFRGESFPLVIIECLQSGVPFLASDLGEISRMLEGPEGMAGAVVPLVGEEIDLPALRDQIVRLASIDTEYQAAQQAVPAATAKFDPLILAQKHDNAYRSALGLTAGQS